MDTLRLPRRSWRRLLQTIEDTVYSPTNYYLVLVLDLLGALCFLVIGFQAPLNVAVRAVAIGTGFMTWGLLEYVIHRWVGHGPPSIARRGHAEHHADQTARIASPMFMIVSGASVIWAALVPIVGAGPAALFVGGAYVGYNHYAIVHHLMHHHGGLVRRIGFQRIERWHRIHHARQDVNFGVTLTLWDRVFGTYCADGFSNTSRS